MSKGNEESSLKQGNVISSIRKNLTCQICDNLFKDPRILPCLHTFCCQCIETLLRNRPLEEKQLKCPTCELDTGLECRKSVRLLPPNSLLISLLDVLLIHQGESIVCDVCDPSEDSSAVVRCRECSLYLCDLHREGHKKARETKNHVSLSLGKCQYLYISRLANTSFSIPSFTERGVILRVQTTPRGAPHTGVANTEKSESLSFHPKCMISAGP